MVKKTASVVLASLSCLIISVSYAADKIDGILFVRDVLTLPGQPARIEAVLSKRGLLGTQQGLGGEQLELIVEGKPVAKAMTGGDGRAFLDYTPKTRGNHELIVRLAADPRVTSPDARALLGAWERRRPILLVEVSAVMQQKKSSPLPVPVLPVPLTGQEDPMPAPDAADELNRLAQFFYNVIYVSWAPKDAGGSMGVKQDVREWLARHKFPSGLSMAVNPGEQALGAKIDQLRTDGWTNVKAGIGRSKAFAEVLVAHRMEVVIVPEPDKGDLPKKAKAVKEWKEIRKKL
jgi:hypothetical protein